jgi:hypothetical protein
LARETPQAVTRYSNIRSRGPDDQASQVQGIDHIDNVAWSNGFARRAPLRDGERTE